MVCRVCLHKSEFELSIFSEDSEDIANLIVKHFWFKPLREDVISTFICLECLKKIRDFHEFYETVKKSHVIYFEQLSLKTEPEENLNEISQFEVVECKPSDGQKNSIQEFKEDTLPADEQDDVVTQPAFDAIECYIENNKPKSKTKKKPTSNNARPKAKSKKMKLSSLTLELKQLKSLKSRQENRSWTNSQTEEFMQKHLNLNCDICSFPASNFDEIEKHFVVTHPSVKAYVKCCNRRFNRRLRAAQHAIWHEDPNAFQCEICKKSFASIYSLRSHTTSIHPNENELLFKCDQCDKRFPRSLLLELHQAVHVPVEERKFSCTECPKTFANQHHLNAHISVCHKSSQVCHICAKSIRDKAAFDKHVRAHFEESGPRVQCPHPGCDKYLKDKENLRIHMRRHKQENLNISCDLCGKIVKNRSALISHKNYAHIERTFACTLCPKVFKRKIILAEHIASHTGKPLYKCPFCERTFNSSANMHAHKKREHPVEWEHWRKTKTTSAQATIV